MFLLLDKAHIFLHLRYLVIGVGYVSKWVVNFLWSLSLGLAFYSSHYDISPFIESVFYEALLPWPFLLFPFSLHNLWGVFYEAFVLTNLIARVLASKSARNESFMNQSRITKFSSYTKFQCDAFHIWRYRAYHQLQYRIIPWFGEWYHEVETIFLCLLYNLHLYLLHMLAPPIKYCGHRLVIHEKC